ncbi:MAG: stage V sporulation protein AC [Epulopiscium sp.]|nr:stage V sporulation protein AC [Candidatus Epulonipiscium sp.]
MDQGQNKKQKFQKRVDEVSPKSNLIVNCAWAFFVGGLICTFGQVMINVIKSLGYNKDDASMITSISLIFISIFLTGIDVYDSIGRYAGAGSVIPITGFANAVASPAIEFKKEGYIFGLGAKMFTVAGPVIVYGVIASVLVGLYHYFIH